MSGLAYIESLATCRALYPTVPLHYGHRYQLLRLHRPHGMMPYVCRSHAVLKLQAAALAAPEAELLARFIDVGTAILAAVPRGELVHIAAGDTDFAIWEAWCGVPELSHAYLPKHLLQGEHRTALPVHVPAPNAEHREAGEPTEHYPTRPLTTVMDGLMVADVAYNATSATYMPIWRLRVCKSHEGMSTLVIFGRCMHNYQHIGERRSMRQKGCSTVYTSDILYSHCSCAVQGHHMGPSRRAALTCGMRTAVEPLLHLAESRQRPVQGQ